MGCLGDYEGHSVCCSCSLLVTFDINYHACGPICCAMLLHFITSCYVQTYVTVPCHNIMCPHAVLDISFLPSVRTIPCI